MFPLFGIRNVFGRQSGSCTGTAWTKFAASGATRSGIEIRNPDASLRLWVRRVERGAAAPAAPTGAGTDADLSIAPDATVFLAYSDTVDVYLCNSSGTSTASSYVASEVGY